MARKLERAGYVSVRKRKHVIYFNPDIGITVPLPHKHAKDLPTGLLNKIIKEMKLTKEEFEQL
jgi:predicted RNA binding protein YcfA (HicA-like mRNA interferase family)